MNFIQNYTLNAVKETFRLTDDCSEDYGTWYFSVYCNDNQSECKFGITIWRMYYYYWYYQKFNYFYF